MKNLFVPGFNSPRSPCWCLYYYFFILYMNINNRFLQSSTFRKQILHLYWEKKHTHTHVHIQTHTLVIMGRWALSFDDADRRAINHTCSRSVKCPNHNYAHYSYHVSSHFIPFTSISVHRISVCPAYLSLSLSMYSISTSANNRGNRGKTFPAKNSLLCVYPL